MPEENTNLKSNPKNLPIIKENSLHRIVTTVKLYQEFNELKRENSEQEAISIFEEKYNNFDQESLESFCFKRYYSKSQKLLAYLNEPIYSSPKIEFTLIKDPETGKSLEIGEYLEFKYDENSINSKKPFYWKEWSFEEDINERKQVIYDFTICFSDVIIDKIKNSVDKDSRTLRINDINGCSNIFTQDLVLNNCNIADADFNFTHFKKRIKFNNTKLNVFTSKSSNYANFLFDFSDTKFINFESSAFSCGSDFYLFKDNEYLNFNKVVFNSDVKFSGFNNVSNIIKTTFKDTTFKKSVAFNNLNFNYIEFSDFIFPEKVEFLNIKLNNSSELVFVNILFPETLRLENLKKNTNDKATISFQDSTFSQKLYFSLADDSKENYQNLTLNLYHASFGDFVCDDRNLAEINLFYSDRNGKVQKEKQKDKNFIEQAIAERRVFRKILQDLNWDDKADEEYAKIMDLQLKLDFLENDKTAKLKEFFFGWWLGWGVRIFPHFKSFSRKDIITCIKYGGLFISTAVLGLIFWLISIFGDLMNSFYRSPPSNCSETTLCRLVNLVFSSNAVYFGDIIIVILGFIQLTLILVIAVRKFMRM